MEEAKNELTLNDLSNDTFFKALRNGEFCLVLGAGFSYGLKNKSQSEYDDEKFIPTGKDFVSLTNRRFNTFFIENEYFKAADEWQENIDNNKVSFSDFKNLFLLDESEFGKKKRNIYSAILSPYWSRIYTFNFDNVLDVLIGRAIDDYEIHNHDVGSFSSANKISVGYLHNSILKANGIHDLVFTNDEYTEKIFTNDNQLYFSLLNDIENHKKNLLIIGCKFNEQSVNTYLLNRIKRKDLKIVHINYKDKPNYGAKFKNKINELSWINCTAEEFLKFLSDNIEEVSKQDVLPMFLEKLKRPIKANIGEKLQAQSFNDFLNSKFLTYFSRGSFKQKLNEESKINFLSENDFLKFITEKNYYGLIIHGQGGIGKTRLMLELGKRLLFNFIVIKVLPDFDNFDELVEYLNRRPNKKYLLLFDYIEEQKIFDKTIKWIASNEISNLRIIGNCRNTFVSDILSNYSEHFKFIDIGFKNKIGLEKKLEREYKKEVILSIIDSISDIKLSAQLKKDDILKSFYQARPSFATFIKYIYLKNPQTKLSISTEEIFSYWLIKKLKLTTVGTISYGNFFEKKKYIFQILSCLPANPDSTNNLEKVKVGDITLADEINKLISDGWIDETDKSLRVVHDTVNDTLLLEFFKHFHFRDFYITDFLEFATETNNISSMMWSIQRVWEDFPHDVTPSIQKNIAKFIDDKINENIATENWFKYKLDNTHLISEQDRIDLFIKHRNLLKENFSLEKMGSSLAFSMEWIHENISDYTIKKKYSEELYDLFFNQWNIKGRFNDFVDDARGGKIISSYINLFGIDNYIEDRFKEYIGIVKCNVNNLELISLAIVSWLHQNGEVDKKLKDLITMWFVVYENEQPEDINPQYLIDCCLSRKLEGIVKYILFEPNIDNLKLSSSYLTIALKIEKSFCSRLITSVYKWFEIYEKEKPKNINPTTLVLTWLEKGDNCSIIRNLIQQIILNPERNVETKAKCIGLWLDKGNEIELVEPFIEEVLSEEIFYKTAYYIIGLWLEKSDNPLLVKPFLCKWLNNISEPQMCSFIFQNWLNKGDDPNLIIEPIKKWLLITTSANSIGNVFSEFISSNGNIYELRNEIIEWLNNNSDSRLSVSVLGYMLEKTNDETLLIDLEIPAIKIFTNFPNQKEIGFSIGYWIGKRGKLSIVEPYINEWLKIYGNSKQSCAIIGEWLEKGGQISIVKEFIVPFLQDNLKDKELSKLMFNWIEHGDDVYLIKDFIKPFFEIKENQEFYESRYLITSWLEKTNLPLYVKDAIKPWLATNYIEPNGSLRVCSFWLKNGTDVTLVEEYVKNHFFDHAEIKDSNQLIEYWIEKSGDKSLIEASLKKFLKKGRKDLNTIYVVVKWLNYNGSIETIEEYIENKLTNYCFHKDSFYVFFAWLKHNGDFNKIISTLIKYLSFNSKDDNAVKIIELCIKLNLFAKELEVFVLKIIELKGYNPFEFFLDITDNKIVLRNNSIIESELTKAENESRKLSFKIKDYLLKGQSPEMIKRDVIEFLTKNGNEDFASHVIAVWIEYGKDFETIRNYLINWLDNNLLNQYRSSFVISAALENQQGFSLVHDRAIEWLNNYGKTANAKFLLSSWLKQKGNDGALEIEKWIFYWVENHYDHAGHNWRDDLLLNYCNESNLYE